jgi:hypothetical protein
MTNYLQYCIEHIESLDLSTDVIKKDQKRSITQVQSYVDAYQSADIQISGKLSYRNFGMFTKVAQKNRHKDMQQILKQDDVAALFSGNGQKKRGRKTKSKILEEQNALDELRKKRKKLVTVLHQEVSELTLINHL